MVSIVEDEPFVSRDAYTVSYKPARPIGRPFARDDLEAMPDDGHRYEIIDGTLLVSAAPGRRHQTAVLELAVLLRAACPDHFRSLSRRSMSCSRTTPSWNRTPLSPVGAG